MNIESIAQYFLVQSRFHLLERSVLAMYDFYYILELNNEYISFLDVKKFLRAFSSAVSPVGHKNIKNYKNAPILWHCVPGSLERGFLSINTSITNY